MSRARETSVLGDITRKILKMEKSPIIVFYTIESQGYIDGDMDEFAQNAHITLNDPRGWSLNGYVKFIRYPSNAIPPPDKRQLRMILASPEIIAQMPGCSGKLSCQWNNCVFINDHRWCYGSPNRPSSLAEYRQYVVNHEVGHWFGLKHVILECSPNNPVLAPVMKQQSRGLHNCIPTTWPLDFEKCEVMRQLGIAGPECNALTYPGPLVSAFQSLRYWVKSILI